MHQPGEAVIVVQWVAGHGVSDKSGFAAFGFDHCPFVLVAVEVNVLGLAHEAMEELREIGKPLDASDTAELARLLFREFCTFPELQFGRGFAEEKDLAMFFVVRIRIKQEDLLFLLNAGQIKEVRIRGHGHSAIGIGHWHVVGVDDGQRIGKQQSFEALPVGTE